MFILHLDWPDACVCMSDCICICRLCFRKLPCSCSRLHQVAGPPAKYLSCSAMARNMLVWWRGLDAISSLHRSSTCDWVTELPMDSPSSVTCTQEPEPAVWWC